MPHHRHNNLFIKCLFAFALNLLFVGKIANGQEFIDRITIPYDDIHLSKLDTMIVREIMPSTRMVFASYQGNANGAFYLIDISDPNAQTLVLYDTDLFNSPLNVKDMEIFNDTVFFCGRYGLGNNDTAIVGYFPLANFPLVDVKIMKVDSLTSFNKMALYHRTEGLQITHLAMIGHGPSDNLYFADAIILADSINLFFLQPNSTIASLDDIIATDTTVTIATRATQDSTGIFYHFFTPSAPGIAPYMVAECDSICIRGISNKHRICLGENGLYAIIQSDTCLAWGNYLSTGKRLIYVNMGDIYGLGSITAFDIHEVHFMPTTKSVDILFYSMIDDGNHIYWGGAVASYIGSNTVLFHIYYDEKLTSFSIRKDNPAYYIATGYDYAVDENVSIALIGFSPKLMGSCATIKSANCKSRLVSFEKNTPLHYPLLYSKILYFSAENYPPILESRIHYCY